MPPKQRGPSPAGSEDSNYGLKPSKSRSPTPVRAWRTAPPKRRTAESHRDPPATRQGGTSPARQGGTSPVRPSPARATGSRSPRRNKASPPRQGSPTRPATSPQRGGSPASPASPGHQGEQRRASPARRASSPLAPPTQKRPRSRSRRNRDRPRSCSRSRPKSRPRSRSRSRQERTGGARRARPMPPADLPVKAFREQIIDLLIENHIIVVVGETGSGKTTQIPQYLLDSERFAKLFGDRRDLRIAITQPRRVAAVAMARRVSQERGTQLGETVGYTIRFEDKSSPRTRLRYMTDGCLLRECLSDPALSSYDVVVLDEAHERSLHTDVLFALMKRAVAERQGGLRVLVTSATLDTGAFSAYFNDCPVLEVPGRSFAVEIHYHPVSKTQRVEAAVNVALNLHVRQETGQGHILVFLTGMEECEQATTLANAKLKELREAGKQVADCVVIPLYGMMRTDDQQNVFDEVPNGTRKLVFSTNIAETSLTVAGVGFVVDCGYCKQKNFNPKTGMESLQVTEVSQVQATQRAGRAGRTQNGHCFRLYSEETFLRSIPKITVPEILRSNLASVVLQMKAMGIQDVVRFDFMEPPDRVRLVRSLRTLFLLGALDADGNLTNLGKSMAALPLEPQFARVLLAADELGCVGEALTLVSMLSAEGVWYRPPRQNAEQIRIADEVQRRFLHRLGDHSTLLNVYRKWEENGSSSEWARENFLHYRALRQARDIREQLSEQLGASGISFRRHGRRAPEDAVLKALCEGFFMQTARMCSAGGGWLIVDEHVLVRPEGGSALDGCTSEWLLFTELVGTTVAHCLMRNVSAVEQDWLRPLLPRLNQVDLKRLVGEAPAKKHEAVPERSAEELAKEKEEKVSSARERFLARRGVK